MRRFAAMFVLGAGIVLGSASGASATHTGCEHGATSNAHATVPHRNHKAHSSIPYCPPNDAPRHRAP